MSKLYTKITSNLDGILFNNLFDICGTCFKSLKTNTDRLTKCPRGQDTRRIINKTIQEASIELCSSNKTDIGNASSLRSKIEVFYFAHSNLLSLYKNKYSEKEIRLRRLLHNIISLNAHNIQEVFSITGDLGKAESAKAQIRNIENSLRDDNRETARAFMNIIKNNAAIKTEIDLFNSLYRVDAALNKKKHNIHQLLMNVLYPFLQDFNDKKILITTQRTEEMISVDYETFRVALYHFFMNAEKYCAPNNQIDITFHVYARTLEMKITMLSFLIEADEIDNIYIEGQCGKYAKKHKRNGEGIGIGFIKQLIEKNNGTFLITNGELKCEIDKIPYGENTFIFTFDRAK